MGMSFVPGIDYGVRVGTLGWAIHMAEGDNPVAWLRRHDGETRAAWAKRVRGVSANFVIEKDGDIVQMVLWNHASGSMNPADQSDSAGFYRQSFINEVLGVHERDPNAWSLSVELAGFRRQGPTPAQVTSLVALVREGSQRFPTIRGAYGHADQTATKGCPGTAPTMMDAWRRIGHGRWRTTVADDKLDDLIGTGGMTRTFPTGTPYFDRPNGTKVGTLTDTTKVFKLVASHDPGGDHPVWYLIDGGGDGRLRWVKG